MIIFPLYSTIKEHPPKLTFPISRVSQDHPQEQLTFLKHLVSYSKKSAADTVCTLFANCAHYWSLITLSPLQERLKVQ